MIERFIRANIKNLNYHLTMGFLENKGIYPTEDEAIVITNFLKENYQEVLRGNEAIFSSLKGKVRNNIFEDTIRLLMDLKRQYW